MAPPSGFTANQATFITRLAADTGLDGGVIAAWCLAEESGGAAVARQASGNNNWLNIGYFDSGAGAIAFNSAFRDPTSAADQTAKFLQGTWGGAGARIGTIIKAKGQSPSVLISTIQRSGWATSGYPSLPSIYAGLSAPAKTAFRANTVPGSGSSGTSGALQNASLPQGFTVGDVSNPNEDFWTAINRLAQERYWYSFSDGETLYLSDGPDLIAQTPATMIDRFGDIARINHLEWTWDNTAWSYTTTHKRRNRVQRHSTLAKVTSPVEGQLNLVCDIDEVRAGDVVVLSSAGPADGRWLVGTCRRSLFSVYSELTLVPGLQPLTEDQIGGKMAGVNSALPSPSIQRTVMSQLIAAAQTLNDANWPYENGGGLRSAGSPDPGDPGGLHQRGFGTRGYDCLGAVYAVLAGGGLYSGKVPAFNSVQKWLSKGLTKGDGSPVEPLSSGQGTGTPECTLFYSSNHIFMRLNGRYFGTADGVGRGPTGPPTPHLDGGGWIDGGSAGRGGPVSVPGVFSAAHFSANTLNKAR